MPDAEHKPIVDEDGDLQLGRHATLWHVELGALDRVSHQPVPVDAVRFEATDAPTPARVFLEYRVDDLEEAWEDTLFEAPLHAEEVATNV